MELVTRLIIKASIISLRKITITELDFSSVVQQPKLNDVSDTSKMSDQR
jgi:hypothetical protein